MLEQWQSYTRNLQPAQRCIMHDVSIPSIIHSEVDIFYMYDWMTIHSAAGSRLHVKISITLIAINVENALIVW